MQRFGSTRVLGSLSHPHNVLFTQAGSPRSRQTSSVASPPRKPKFFLGRTIERKKKPKVLSSRWKPFQLPDVVLDLDDYDSKVVRVYDDQDEQKQKMKWANDVPKILDRKIENFHAGAAWSDKAVKLVRNDKTNPWRISDHDVLTAALCGYAPRGALGDGIGEYSVSEISSQDGSPRPMLATVLLRNGIPTRLCRDEKMLLQWMLQRQSIAANTPEEATSLKSKLSELKSLSEVRRLVSYTMQTESGVRLVAQCQQEIASKCTEVAEKNGEIAGTVAFLNNLMAGLRQHQIDISESLRTVSSSLSAER